ncbi:MAG: hypothetical protein HKN44_12625 [Ilumatobacter sp.]|nr:hypothetical protein [Ilumatobacter sp.]
MARTSTDPADQPDTTRKGYTAPKGRPTARSGELAARRGLSPTLEWIIVILVLLAVFGAIFYFGRNVGDSGVHNGAAVPIASLVAAALGV